MYIAENQNQIPWGQIRFQAMDKEAEVSVNLCPDFRGSGLGSELIRLASERYLDERGPKNIFALIKKENRTSISAFSKAGYAMAGNETDGDIAGFRMVFQGESIV